MMNELKSNGECIFSSAILDAVRVSVENVFYVLCGEKPLLSTNGQGIYNGPCVAGIISFFGDVAWSLSWVLTQETAPAIVQKFAGFKIPFDSPEMGDAAGELVNVLAGEVVAQLEDRRIKVQMSLPTVVRGKPLELIPETGLSVARLDFTSKQGDFWIRLATARSGQIIGRVPGK
jgi:CheY-specific phosphatase CheX